LAGHNVLRAHAYAVDIYRRKYQSTQKGKIGITVDISYYEPYDPNSQLDIEAAERAAIWHGGWFVDPVYFGDYPAVMKERVGNRLPKWSEEDRTLIKGSSDFFGLNHYTTSYVIHIENVDDDIEGYYRDRGCVTTSERDGKLIGPRGEPTWLFVVPRGMRGVLNWVSNRYGNPDIYITENGVSAPGENRMKIEDALEDQFRVDYYRDYIDEMSKAIKIDKVNVIGYMAWSLVDNFEWADGYEKRFGLFYVDFKNNFTRIPKKSAKWYAKLIELNSS
jgi:beta-glucosidase